MLQVRYLFFLTLLHWVPATPRLNLYYTHSASKDRKANVPQHDCLRVATDIKKVGDDDYIRELILYCMSDLSPIISVENNDFISTFTFADLYKQNISSQQLYRWSAPIDIIEHYQFYLNQLSTLNDSSLGTNVFYNCTMPRFGPKCQYEFDHFHPTHSSLYDVIHDFYTTFEYNPTTLTCYIHLKCNRGALLACLDWSEICNGQIDCLDSGVDEEHCWQLEINQCQDDEYRCINGQCIPKLFFQDDQHNPDCLDSSDEFIIPVFARRCEIAEPSFKCEDITCPAETHLPSSCTIKRNRLLLETIYSIKGNSISSQCWSASKCILDPTDSDKLFCENLCAKNACIYTVLSACPEFLYFPNSPILFGNVYFVYRKSDLQQYLTTENVWQFYICSTTSFHDSFFNMVPKISLDNRTCFLDETISYSTIQSSFLDTVHQKSLKQLYKELKLYHLMYKYTSTICNRLNMYQCISSSKCISIHRLLDGTYDCPHMDDEDITVFNNTDIMEQVKETHYKCQASNKYIAQSFISIGPCPCGFTETGFCPDAYWISFNPERDISFQTICDGFVELLPRIIDKRNETDETECEQWQCDNIYTHCDGIWNCLNGADEIDCGPSPLLDCSSNHHLCVSPDTNQFMCLPIGKANDGHVDCLGATDEASLCREKRTRRQRYNFYCRNQIIEPCVVSDILCDGYPHCDYKDDEQFCDKNRTLSLDGGVCFLAYLSLQSDVEKFLCNRTDYYAKTLTVYFILDQIRNSVKYETKNIEHTVLSSSSNVQISDQRQSPCHRGLKLRVWLNDKTKNTCLCPPSYYGSQCQYQNQRISLTLRFRALSDSYEIPFAIVISLIDDSDNRIIHSYEHITYSSVRDCTTKFNIYLAYSTRPKDPTKQYAVHIDFYEKLSLIHRGSVLELVQFPFLPVHRLAFMIDIPRSDNKTQSCFNAQCIYGKCIKYSNNPVNLTFCQCDPGWSGRYCTIPHTCQCLDDALCIGISADNRSICVCPINKYGSRCLLTDPTCQINTCQNGGQCIFDDHYLAYDQKFLCICPKGFSGDRCEIADKKVILSFGKDIILSQQMFIHFIEVIDGSDPIRLTTIRSISLRQDSITIHWEKPFHLVFIELIKKNYYLAATQKISNRSVPIVKMINPSDRCPNITEVLNETIVQWHLLRRIKYYHLPCQNQSLNLSCFHDDVHLCLCYTFNHQRLANCLNFNHNMTFNCHGRSVCENAAHCLQDDLHCPRRSVCMCLKCYYGQRCQFTTSGFGLSLDGIIGYQILSSVDINHQPMIIKITLGLTIIFVIAGLVNGILSMITFKNKSVREVGCGLYLFGSASTTILIMLMFGLKFVILLCAQMNILSNRSFLSFQCHSIDFILRICLAMDQWLNACVATERAITVIKGTRFVKKKSRQTAKFVILILLIGIVGTSIHDPISRSLIEEEDNNDENNIKRTWCIVTYSSVVQFYNYLMHIFHFFGPFLINLTAAVIIITKKTRQQLKLQKNCTYKELLFKQFQQHKHLLTAPIVLVILALPRLMIIFMSKCMESTADSWLFLLGYFISFIPPILPFFIFVLPSEFYKKEFQKSFAQYRTRIRRYRPFTSIH